MLDNLDKFCPAAVPFKDALIAAFVKFNVSTVAQRRSFLAEYAHETQGFTHLAENLNYGVDGLLKTWPTRFTDALANECARNPEKIANVVYAGRMGNGSTETGDGWKYRGRGLPMLTGKTAYHQLSISLFADDRLLENPDYLLTPEGACMAGGWYWQSTGCAKYADAGDFDGVSDVINLGHKTKAEGDSIGYKDRLHWLTIANDTIT